jgi:hypothetical protein
MVGVARVLNAQYGFYMTDVNNVFLRLKKALVSLQSTNINMAVSEARYFSTFNSDLYLQVEMRLLIWNFQKNPSGIYLNRVSISMIFYMQTVKLTKLKVN